MKTKSFVSLTVSFFLFLSTQAFADAPGHDPAFMVQTLRADYVERVLKLSAKHGGLDVHLRNGEVRRYFVDQADDLDGTFCYRANGLRKSLKTCERVHTFAARLAGDAMLREVIAVIR